MLSAPKKRIGPDGADGGKRPFSRIGLGSSLGAAAGAVPEKRIGLLRGPSMVIALPKG